MLQSIFNTEKNGVSSLNKYYLSPAFFWNYIRYFWTLEVSKPKENYKLLDAKASRFPRLIFQHLHDCNAIIDKQGNALPLSWIKGLSTRPVSYTMYGRYAHTGVSFQPPGLKFLFGIDAHLVTDVRVDLQDITDRRLNEKMYAATSDEERIRVLCHFFEEKLNENQNYNSLLTSGVILDNFNPTEHGVHHMARRLNISERQLQRKFKSDIGVNPIKYLKLKRFEAALERMNKQQELPLTEVAHELHYADQSHFIREFKELSGSTPGQFVKSGFLMQEGSAFLKQSET